MRILIFLKKYLLLVLFTAFILITSTANLFVPDREKSEMENRNLEQRPKVTVSALLAKNDKDKFSQKYEKYANDQFIGRDAWITLKSVSESALGKIENNGIVYGKEHHLFERYEALDERRLSMNIEMLGNYSKTYGDLVPITVAVIPNSYQILQDKLPAGLQNLDQAARITQIYSALPENVQTLDLLPVMKQAVSDAEKENPSHFPATELQTYYRTDHHWTTYGAYAAYQAFVQSRGLQAVPLSTLTPLAQQVPDFYGSYYSKCKLFSAVPDVITWYDLPFDSITVGGKEKSGLYEMEKWNERDKHAAFLWGNNDVTVIKTSNNLNHQNGKTSRILLIKDSFGNPFAPFLTYSYDEVWVVDLRNLTVTMKQLMNETQFTDVLVMYNFMNFASDPNFTFLNR